MSTKRRRKKVNYLKLFSLIIITIILIGGISYGLIKASDLLSKEPPKNPNQDIQKEEPVQNAGVFKEDDNSSLNFDLSSLNQEINQSTNVPSFETTLNETQQVIESSGMEIPDTWDKLPDAMISTFTGIEEPKELPKTEPVAESTNAGISSLICLDAEIILE